MRAATICIGIVATLTATTSAMAFDQAAAQQACGNDVYALCQKAVPDQKRITACMQRHFKQVSATCRQFMAASDAEMRPARRGATR
jgi:Cysteine rich repeat